MSISKDVIKQCLISMQCDADAHELRSCIWFLSFIHIVSSVYIPI